MNEEKLIIIGLVRNNYHKFVDLHFQSGLSKGNLKENLFELIMMKVLFESKRGYYQFLDDDYTHPSWNV